MAQASNSLKISSVRVSYDDLIKARDHIIDIRKATFRLESSEQEDRILLVFIQFESELAPLYTLILERLGLPPGSLLCAFMPDRTRQSSFLQVMSPAVFFEPSAVKKPIRDAYRKWKVHKKYLLDWQIDEVPDPAKLKTSIERAVMSFTDEFNSTYRNHALKLNFSIEEAFPRTRDRLTPSPVTPAAASPQAFPEPLMVTDSSSALSKKADLIDDSENDLSNYRFPDSFCSDADLSLLPL